MSDIVATQVNIPAADGVIDAHAYHPVGPGAWPAVLLFTDIRGVRPVFEAMGQRLAALGYAVLLPNTYYRGGRAPVVDPTLPVADDAAKGRRAVLRATLTPEALRADIAVLLDYLTAQPYVRGPQTGVIGYCMSGSFALRAAAAFPDRIAAAASFHGGGLATEAPDSPHLNVERIKAQLYFGHAEADASMPPEAIARLDSALTQAGVKFTSEIYAARHGFAVTDGAAYDEAAAEKHWHNLLGLFDAALGQKTVSS
jgi:carboxymethylenebutenolidase